MATGTPTASREPLRAAHRPTPAPFRRPSLPSAKAPLFFPQPSAQRAAPTVALRQISRGLATPGGTLRRQSPALGGVPVGLRGPSRVGLVGSVAFRGLHRVGEKGSVTRRLRSPRRRQAAVTLRPRFFPESRASVALRPQSRRLGGGSVTLQRPGKHREHPLSGPLPAIWPEKPPLRLFTCTATISLALTPPILFHSPSSAQKALFADAGGCQGLFGVSSPKTTRTGRRKIPVWPIRK